MRKFTFRRKPKASDARTEAGKEQPERSEVVAQRDQPVQRSGGSNSSKNPDDANSEAGKSFISVSRMTETQRKYLDEDQELYAIMKMIQASSEHITRGVYSPIEEASDDEQATTRNEAESKKNQWIRMPKFSRRRLAPKQNPPYGPPPPPRNISLSTSPIPKWPSLFGRSGKGGGRPKADETAVPLIQDMSLASRDVVVSRSSDSDGENSVDAVFTDYPYREDSSVAYPRGESSSSEAERNLLRNVRSLLTETTDGEDTLSAAYLSEDNDTETDLDVAVHDVLASGYDGARRDRSGGGDSTSSAGGERSTDYSEWSKSTQSTTTDELSMEEEEASGGDECYFSMRNGFQSVLSMVQGGEVDGGGDGGSRDEKHRHYHHHHQRRTRRDECTGCID